MSVKFKPTQIAMPLSANYGRWYAKMVPTATVTSRQLSEEVGHSSTVTQADMLAVLNELSVVLRKHLLNSDRVEIDGIGAFKVGLCTAAANTAADFGALSFVTLLHVTCYIKVVSQCSLYSVIAGPSARFGSRSVNPKLKVLMPFSPEMISRCAVSQDAVFGYFS